MAISKHPCRVLPQSCKKLPSAGQGQEHLVNIAFPPLPKLPLDKFHLCAIRQNLRKYTTGKSILWIFQDPMPVLTYGDSSQSDCS